MRADLSGRDLQSKVKIGPSGEMLGDIKVPTVMVSGQVEGDDYASAHISLLASARVNGNIFYSSMEMAKGGQFTGSIRQLESAMVVEQAEVRMAQRAATVTSIKST